MRKQEKGHARAGVGLTRDYFPVKREGCTILIATRNRPAYISGFSLLEAVIAVAIIGICTVAVLSAFAVELRTAERARRNLEAMSLAEHRVAELRLLPAAELRVLPEPIRRGRFAPPLDSYRWESSVNLVVDERDLYQVTVLVYWGEGEYPLRTRLYRPNEMVRLHEAFE